MVIAVLAALFTFSVVLVVEAFFAALYLMGRAAVRAVRNRNNDFDYS